MRPWHWVKTIACLPPLFFSVEACYLNSWLSIFPLLIIFSFVSSAGYIINDLHNILEDKIHPKKRYRPIASGRVSLQQSILTVMLLYSISAYLGFTFYGSGKVFNTVLCYIGSNLLYTFYLRKVAYIDIFTISLGFVLRLVAGTYAIGSSPSLWLILLTFQLAYLIALGKRKGELTTIRKSQIEIGDTRHTLKWFIGDFSSIAVIILSITTSITYVMYGVVIQGAWPFTVTVLPVIVALSSYVREVERSSTVETPVRMLAKDPAIIISFLTWVLLTTFIIY